MSVSDTISHYRAFFDDFQRLSSQFWQLRLHEDLLHYNEFFGRFNSISPDLQMLSRQKAPYYNIFQILRIRHYEEKVHTPFIAHLLDPHESHGQGTLFMDHFFLGILGIDPSGIDPMKFYVENEVVVDKENRIDLLIDYHYEGKRKIVLIENKIYARDLRSA